MDELKNGYLQLDMRTASENSQHRRKVGSIFNITERNEESEITGGTCSMLSNILRGDTEEALKSQLNRLSLLSQNLNSNLELQLLSNEDDLQSYGRLKFGSAGGLSAKE